MFKVSVAKARWTRHAIGMGNMNMTNFFREFLRDESGAAAAEYALILAIVGSGIALAAVTLGDSIANALGRATTAIDAVTYT